MFASLRNLLKLARHDRHLYARAAVFYVTEQCNLNCAYCEDFGTRRNNNNFPPLPLEQVMKILGVVRTGVEALMLTGGETLTHPDIDEIALRAKRELMFREVTLISNGLLLPKHEAALTAVDRLIISLDSADASAWSQTIGISPASAGTIIDNVRHYAEEQHRFGYRMVVNAVLTPETLPGAEALLDFCFSLGAGRQRTSSGDRRPQKGRHAGPPLLISFSPQSYNNWPRYELMVSPEYKAFLQKLSKLKRGGAPILASEHYLKTMRDLAPYDCYPTLIPRILANGDLVYPCRPFEKADNGQGGRPVNLLGVSTWAEAWRKASAAYGQPPRTCHSCFQQCYTEPSLMQARPLLMAWEWLRYPAVRRGNLATYAPG
jgi:MoaA/NifB/PqqE/SkfB family radical SAM enzyme